MKRGWPHPQPLAQAVVVLAACWLAWVPDPVLARTMQQKLAAACAVDAVSLCPQAASDPDALKACLMTKRSKVSAACMQMIDASE